MYLNWGRNKFYNKQILYPKNIKEVKEIVKISKNIGICGNLRSFGDTCINSTQLISLKKLNGFLKLDKENQILHISSNYLLIDILKKIVPEGLMIEVTPGSKYVTVGGMISNNVFGKNSIKNQFKHLVKEIEILNSQNKILKCSPFKNKKLFDLTIGGFGITGIILSTKIKLKKIKNQFIDQEIKKFSNIKQFIELSKKPSTFNVSWVDSHSLSSKNFKGITYKGEYNQIRKNPKKYLFSNSKMMFLEKFFLINYIKFPFLSKIINSFFILFKRKKSTILFDKFFYPQDKWIDYNNCYKNGFIQVQFLVKSTNFEKIMEKISIFLKNNEVFSTFIIIKKIQEKGSYINFFGNGYSVSFDFEKNKNFEKIKIFFNQLFNEYSLKVNFSKDIIYKKKNILNNKLYIKIKKDLKQIDKNKLFSNDFSKRLMIK